MKFLKVIFILNILYCYPIQIVYAKNDTLHSTQYILYNRNDENIITSNNEQSQIDPNIFTQWLSALLIIENTRHYDKEFSLSFNDFNTTFTSELGLGEYISVQDALFSILMNHDGSATSAAARHMAGSNQEFIRLLNKKAKNSGMKNTNFTNATGDREFNQYTTLEDLAILVHHALNNDIFNKILSMQEYTFTSNIQTHTLINEEYNLFENKNIYGVTKFQLADSLYGVVSAYKYDIKEYIYIALSDKLDNCIEDTKNIYTYTASSQHFITPLKKENVIGNISLGFYLKRNIPIVLQDNITILTNKETDLSTLSYEFTPNINSILIFPNSFIGTINIYKDDILIKSSSIHSSKLYISYELYFLILIEICTICFAFYKKHSNNAK